MIAARAMTRPGDTSNMTAHTQTRITRNPMGRMTHGFPPLLFALCAALLLPSPCVSRPFNLVLWNEFVKKIEEQAVDLAREVERLYPNRCNSLWLADCERANYDHCLSSYEEPVCLGGESFFVDQCGNATTGASVYDYSCSTVAIPELDANGENGNPTDPRLIETVCFSRDLDAWFKRTFEASKGSWGEKFGVEPWAMYFGSHTGAFRIYPARRFYDCGAYDPRIRPWYVAASTGPKNVIMILDTSGSMYGYRLDLMKQAARRVVETLSVGDRIAIIPFNTDVGKPIVDTGGNLFVATNDIKETLYEEIDGLIASGSTNFLAAYEEAFAVLERSIDQEVIVECYTAVLFFTDGQMTHPKNVSEQAVIDFVVDKAENITNTLGKPVMLFTNSISEEEADAHTFPSDLACSTEYGVWSKITSDEDIVDSFSSYYKLLALGLGSDRNEDFVAWVEPYKFASGSVAGTTVSVPVYDRTKDPSLFLGVVGVDVAMSALAESMGIDGMEEVIERVTLQSGAKCPSLNLTLCELESYRRQGVAGDLAMCTDNCTDADLVPVEEAPCPDQSDHPRDLWINVDDAQVPYEDSTCCDVDAEVQERQSSGAIPPGVLRMAFRQRLDSITAVFAVAIISVLMF